MSKELEYALREVQPFLKEWKAAGRSEDDLIHGCLVPYGLGCDFENKAVKENNEPIIEARISRNTNDRMGDDIDQEGWDFSNFQKNPVVLWGHDYSSLPVGKNVGLQVKWKTSLYAKTLFASFNEKAMEVYKFYENKFLNAWSVGFLPKSWEVKEDEKGTFIGFHFANQELMEYSAVPVPAHPDAVGEMARKGLIDPYVAKLLKSSLPVPEPSDDDASAAQATLDEARALGMLMEARKINQMLRQRRG